APQRRQLPAPGGPHWPRRRPGPRHLPGGGPRVEPDGEHRALSAPPVRAPSVEGGAGQLQGAEKSESLRQAGGQEEKGQRQEGCGQERSEERRVGKESKNKCGTYPYHD